MEEGELYVRERQTEIDRERKASKGRGARAGKRVTRVFVAFKRIIQKCCELRTL